MGTALNANGLIVFFCVHPGTPLPTALTEGPGRLWAPHTPTVIQGQL